MSAGGIQLPSAVRHADRIRRAALECKEQPCPYACSGSIERPSLEVSYAAHAGTTTSCISFPAAEEQLTALIGLCEEASFGFGQQAVLDPTYRKALALAKDKFSTTFDPASQHILSTIRTVMMPDAATVTAELYKLNIYRPGDFFKVHVDTPRGDGMFGSLVVCLPQTHTGGALLVRHEGHEQRFDFASESSNQVQWAAFYSDCEHEIKEVFSGQRITLTYNLYSCGTAVMPAPGISKETQPLFNALAAALMSGNFLPRGGEIAFPTQHTYPHTSENRCDQVHTMLKGKDARWHRVFQKLGLQPRVQAVLDFHHFQGGVYGGKEDEGEGKGEGEGEGSRSEEDGVEHGQSDHNLRIDDPSGLYEHEERELVQGETDISTDWDIYTQARPATGIVWLAFNPQYKLQYSCGAYGNDPHTVSVYSAAAVFAEVPAWGTVERQALASELATTPGTGEEGEADGQMSTYNSESSHSVEDSEKDESGGEDEDEREEEGDEDDLMHY